MVIIYIIQYSIFLKSVRNFFKKVSHYERFNNPITNTTSNITYIY